MVFLLRKDISFFTIEYIFPTHKNNGQADEKVEALYVDDISNQAYRYRAVFLH